MLSWIGIGLGIGLGIALPAKWRIPPKNKSGTIITFASAISGAIAGGIVNAGSSAESLGSVDGASLICATGGALLALLGVKLLKTTLYIER